MLIWSLRDLLQNQSLEIFLICIVVLYFPHNNTALFTCMMNVRHQTRQAFVTSFSLFCDRTGKFVNRPKNVRSPNTSQIQTFENNLWQTVDNYSTDAFFL